MLASLLAILFVLLSYLQIFVWISQNFDLLLIFAIYYLFPIQFSQYYPVNRYTNFIYQYLYLQSQSLFLTYFIQNQTSSSLSFSYLSLFLHSDLVTIYQNLHHKQSLILIQKLINNCLKFGGINQQEYQKPNVFMALSGIIILYQKVVQLWIDELVNYFLGAEYQYSYYHSFDYQNWGTFIIYKIRLILIHQQQFKYNINQWKYNNFVNFYTQIIFQRQGYYIVVKIYLSYYNFFIFISPQFRSNMLDQTRLQKLIQVERQIYKNKLPKSFQAYQSAKNLLGRVPMTWMNKWSGNFPPYLAKAKGNRIIDIDGNQYVDFALGDTGAMTGHSPDATVETVIKRTKQDGGLTAMLPTQDAQIAGQQLAKRFGLPYWSFSLSATDANRWVLRLARLVTNRKKILVFSYSYHGSVDQTFVVVHNDQPSHRPGLVAPSVCPTTTTRVVEFNDFEALKRELSYQDVAAVLMEPAMTNIGIVLPEPGFLQFVRSQTLKTGTLLINDQTHTFSAGYGGATKAMNLKPDIITIGKCIGGGIACGAFGVTAQLSQKIMHAKNVDLVDVGGVGGTLAGNALSMAAIRATLENVLTQEAFKRMIKLCDRFTKQSQQLLNKYDIPWSIVQLGARAQYRFIKPAPKNGGQSMKAGNDMLDEYMHLFMLNRGILMTPFHNMALMCPSTTDQDVAKHTKLFEQALSQLKNVYIKAKL